MQRIDGLSGGGTTAADWKRSSATLPPGLSAVPVAWYPDLHYDLTVVPYRQEAYHGYRKLVRADHRHLFDRTFPASIKD